MADEAEQLLADFEAIAPPRTIYELDHFVIGRHETREQQFAQCTLELQNALIAGMKAKIGERKTLRKIEWLEAKARGESYDLEAKKRADAQDDADATKLDLFVFRLASIGNDYQIGHLNKRRKELGHFTREQIDASDPERWKIRAIRQASQDVTAMGRVSVGNQDMLRMMNEPVPVSPDHVAALEKRFLEIGKQRILVAVPTLIDRETVKSNGLRCLDGWILPGTWEQRRYVITGKPVADAYMDAAFTAIEDQTDFLLCVEDDHIIPQGTFERLWTVYEQNGPRAIVGAWYPQKKEPRTGAPIILKNGRRAYLDDDGTVHEVCVVTQGFTLIPTAIFQELPQPWFVTTGCMSQDGFFSQLAREAGWKLFVDTGARIQHVCRDTGRIYE